MSNFNRVILMGNLTRDPEVRTLMGGAKVAKIGLAINRKYNDRDGQTREETTFVDIDFFGRMAEILERYARKGGGLHVEGRLKLDTWQDKDTGSNRQRLGVIGERFQFVGGRAAGSSATAEDNDDSVPF